MTHKSRQKPKMVRVILIGFLLLNGVFAYSQDLPTILKKHFEAHGQELWDQVNTVVIDGKWVTNEFDKHPLKMTFKHPNKLRLEGTWHSKKYIEVTNGKIAWTVAPWTGTSQVQFMEPLEHLIIENVFRQGSSLKSHTRKISLDGLELFEGELLIKLSYEDHHIQKTYYLGKDDYVLYWEIIKSKVGKKYEIRKQYEKYHNYHGLLSPTAVRIFSEKGERELIFDDVSLGLGASSTLFEMPKSQ